MPVPSRSSLDGDVGLLGGALDVARCGRSCSSGLLMAGAVRWRRVRHCARRRRSRRPARWWRAGIRGSRRRGSARRRRDSAARRGHVGEPTEQQEVRVAGDHAEPLPASPLSTRSRSADSSCTLPRVSSACRNAARAAACVTDRQVVRQAHQQQRVDHRRRGDQVAEPSAGERERLAHRPGHDELRRVLVDQCDRAGLRREFGVRLVDDHDARAPRRGAGAVPRAKRCAPSGCWGW